MNINDYQILVAERSSDLADLIKHAFKENWVLYGSPYSKAHWHCQAMVKEGPVNAPIRGLPK